LTRQGTYTAAVITRRMTALITASFPTGMGLMIEENPRIKRILKILEPIILPMRNKATKKDSYCDKQ